MKHHLGSITFYITNVCNFNCDNCNYLNNYPVKGHQRWKDNKDNCLLWSEKFDPCRIFVLGGEPMLNPDFLLWIEGLAQIWPKAEIRINTNGSSFDRWPNLYEILLKYKGRITISISGHNQNFRTKEIETIKNFLKGSITKRPSKEKSFQLWVWKKVYDDIKGQDWPEVNSLNDYDNLPTNIKSEIESVYKININDYMDYDEPVEDYEVYIDENGIKVAWARWDEFSNSALKFDNKTLTLHNSDPIKAVSHCHGGHCAYIKDGKLYKCAVMGILPDMLNQGFPIDISESDKNLILSYKPALPSWNFDELSNFVYGLENQDPIPQCKFCPEEVTVNKIYATTKKIKFHKLKNKSFIDKTI